MEDSDFIKHVLNALGNLSDEQNDTSTDNQPQNNDNDKSQSQSQSQGQGNGQENQSSQSNQDDSSDSEGQKQNNNQGKQNSKSGKYGNFDEHSKDVKPGKYTPLDGTKPNNSPITEQDIAEAIRNAQTIQQLGNNGGRIAGSGAGNKQIDIINKHRAPIQSWKAVMRDMVRKVTQTRSFARINNRLAAARVIAPSVKKQLINSDIIFAIDVSGSMRGKPMTDTINEIVSLSRSTPIVNMRVIYWDAEVMNDILVRNSKSLASQSSTFSFTGGGGTNINCVYDYIMEKQYKPTGIVYLTDGYVNGDKFYTQNNCKNVVILTYNGDYEGMIKIKNNTGYANNQLQIVRSELGKPDNI
jgi:predicted metal-dependent peptidase